MRKLYLNSDSFVKIRHLSIYKYSLYFLKGYHDKKLSPKNADLFLNVMKQNKFKTSTYLYNSYQSKQKYHNWKIKLPWIQPFYAVKANPSIQIIQDLVQQGSNFDCASQNQIETILAKGIKPQQIVYSNTIKDQEQLKWASSKDISLTTADTYEQLRKIKQYAPNMKILWRIQVPKDQKDNHLIDLSQKFGDQLKTVDQISKRLKQIKQLKVNLAGIHFHCGSGQNGSLSFQRAIKTAKKWMKLGRQIGHQMRIMDIGGGFPAGEINEQTVNALKLTQNDPLKYKVIAEPGRHFSSDAFYLLTKVIGKKIIKGRPYYYLNDSIGQNFKGIFIQYGGFQEGSSDQFYRKIDSSTRIQAFQLSTHASTICGNSTNIRDILSKNINVPNELIANDWLCIAGMGAYHYAIREHSDKQQTFNVNFQLEKIPQQNQFFTQQVIAKY